MDFTEVSKVHCEKKKKKLVRFIMQQQSIRNTNITRTSGQLLFEKAIGDIIIKTTTLVASLRYVIMSQNVLLWALMDTSE